MELVIASLNSQKVLQIRRILKELLPKAATRSLYDFPDFIPIEPMSEGLLERARLKALHAAKSLGVACLVEQWELVIPSIDLTSLFQKHSTVTSQIKEILEKLATENELKRAAYYESAVSLATPQGKVYQALSRVEGTIAEAERGKGSLDFDSIFTKYDYVKTFAELPESVKLRISPLRKALEKLLIHFEGS
jgi:XTP/dITP diphosphohydrolase